MGTSGRSWRSRILWIPVLALTLVGGAVALVLGPRWGAIRCLQVNSGPSPELHQLPVGVELVEGAQALGFERALIARPEDVDGNRPVLVFVTGIVDEHGVENPRVVRAAHAFRQAGHIVFIPEVGMYVDPARPVDDLAMLVTSLRRVASGEIEGSRKEAFGLVGVSLGGALALRALADFRRDGGRGCRAVLAIGAPGNLYAESEPWFAMPRFDEGQPSGPEKERRKAAAFARNVLYRAALPRMVRNEADRKILKAWLDDKWVPKNGPETPLVSKDAQWVVSSFMGGPEVWKADRERVLRHGWYRTRYSSPVEWRERFAEYEGVALFLMHGIHDPLISIASLGHLEMFLSRHTMTVALRSEMIGHVDVADVSLMVKLRHVAFVDDFLDMVGG